MSFPSASIRAFFHQATSTVTYLVADPDAGEAAIIDPVLDYDHASGRARVDSANEILSIAKELDLRITWILETHAHADHLSAAPFLQQQTGARTGIGEHIRDVQQIFRPIFNLSDISGNGGEFDRLFRDGERFSLGSLQVEVMHTPGHTPACVSYRIGQAVFVGDTLFMPDYGTARADFPGGDAAVLYRSIQKLIALPADSRLFMCHDYKPPTRDYHAWETTVAEQRAENIHIRHGVSEQAFVAMRNARDAHLPAPALLLPSIQVNVRAGRFPRAESNGVRYLKIPVRFDARAEPTSGG
jgi:glyoxylase-like metal-dependent hydrolase (beta-lactamase superfamily II)